MKKKVKNSKKYCCQSYHKRSDADINKVTSLLFNTTNNYKATKAAYDHQRASPDYIPCDSTPLVPNYCFLTSCKAK